MRRRERRRLQERSLYRRGLHSYQYDGSIFVVLLSYKSPQVYLKTMLAFFLGRWLAQQFHSVYRGHEAMPTKRSAIEVTATRQKGMDREQHRVMASPSKTLSAGFEVGAWNKETEPLAFNSRSYQERPGVLTGHPRYPPFWAL